MNGPIRIEREDSGICTLRFNRPERLNALTWQGMQDFAAAKACSLGKALL